MNATLTITDLEKAVLETAKNHLNYTINYCGTKEAALAANISDNAGWFGVERVKGDPKLLRGAISSLVKKELIMVDSHCETKLVKVRGVWTRKVIDVPGDICPTEKGIKYIFEEMME